MARLLTHRILLGVSSINRRRIALIQLDRVGARLQVNSDAPDKVVFASSLREEIKGSRTRHVCEGRCPICIETGLGHEIIAKRIAALLAELIAHQACVGPGGYSAASSLGAQTGLGQNILRTILQHDQRLTREKIRNTWPR